MPLEEADLKTIDERLEAKLKETTEQSKQALNIAVSLKQQIAKLPSSDDLTGIRASLDDLTGKLKGGGNGNGDEDKSKGKPSGSDEVAAQNQQLREELKRSSELMLNEKKANAIAKGIESMEFVKGFQREDFEPKLMQQIKAVEVERNGAKFYELKMKEKRLIAGSKDTYEEVEVDAVEGVKNFFRSKPYLLAGSAQSGSGAGGHKPPVGNDYTGTLKDLMADPTEYAKAQKENPELIQRLRAEQDKARASKRA